MIQIGCWRADLNGLGRMDKCGLGNRFSMCGTLQEDSYHAVMGWPQIRVKLECALQVRLGIVELAEHEIAKANIVIEQCRSIIARLQCRIVERYRLPGDFCFG